MIIKSTNKLKPIIIGRVTMLKLWIMFLIIFLIALTSWGIFFIQDINSKILVFGIVGALITAITSVYSVILNHNKFKERELELIRIKEKQRFYLHFYNAYFDLLQKAKKSKDKAIPPEIIKNLLEFKKGLANWGSEELIANYLEFDAKIQQPADPKDPYRIIRDGDKFLKDLRKDLGFQDSGKVNIMSIVLDPDARKDFNTNQKH